MLAFRWSLLALIGLSILPMTPAPTGYAAPAGPEGEAGSLDGLVAQLVAASKLQPASVSVAIVDPQTGTVLGSHRGSDRVLPASCMKVVTTAAAITSLGADYPLKTHLLAAPPGRGAEAGVVAGDLWLVGYGDPGFSEHGPEGSTLAAMDAFAAQAAAKGVRQVRGDLVFDASFFDGPRVHPSWTDAGASARWYAAEVDALTCNDGCIDVAVEPGDGPGSPGRVRLVPETSAVTVVNRTTTTAVRKEHGFGFRLADADNTLEVNGRVWTKSADARSPAAIHDPALLCAEQVGRALARAGVRVGGVVRRPREGEERPAGVALLAEHRTSLAAACAVANTRSQNLWAETLLRVLGAARKGEGSFAAGAAAVREALAAAGPEVADGILQADGSGLSRQSEASALALARVLAFAWRGPHRDAYFQGMARPGTGTLDDRFREKRFEGRVFAKTGTLKGVSGLCGLAVGHSGRSYVFAVLGEHVSVGNCRKLQDGVVGALVGSPPNAARK
jgi:D-alanyl-D-alanine carboxypeptidase/D-alanyl-D-alanine-endopeptidase (penicillin-binding protein 4)